MGCSDPMHELLMSQGHLQAPILVASFINLLRKYILNALLGYLDPFSILSDIPREGKDHLEASLSRKE